MLIIIPTYNAADQVGRVVQGALRSGFPVVVVDDGSSDDSAAQAAAAGAHVLRHHANRGKGAALQTGFAYARTQDVEGVLTLDADGQHNTEEIAALVAAWRATPGSLVLGVRSFDPSLMPRRSRIGNHISTFFISRFAGRPHRDTQTGFRIYPRALLSLPLTTRRFDTETELLLWASKLGVPLVEVAVQTIYFAGPVDAADAATNAEPGASPGDSGAGNATHGNAPRTHFRNWEDTLRVIALVIGSPWWRPEKLNLDIARSASST